MILYATVMTRVASFAAAIVLTTSIAGAQAAPMKMDKMGMKQDAIAKMPWGPGPDFLPKGAKMHVVSGDPGAAGPFVLHLMFPNGYTIKPHNHPTDEHAKVVSGTLLYGMGDKIERKAMKAVKKGQEENFPAKMNHFVATRGRTVVEVASTGPFQITYVNAKDDPRGMKK